MILIGVFSRVTTEIGRALTYSCLPGIRVRGIDKSTTHRTYTPPPSPVNSTSSRNRLIDNSSLVLPPVRPCVCAAVQKKKRKRKEKVGSDESIHPTTLFFFFQRSGFIISTKSIYFYKINKLQALKNEGAKLCSSFRGV